MKSKPMILVLGFVFILMFCSGASDEIISSGETSPEGGGSEAETGAIPYPEVRIKPFPSSLFAPDSTEIPLFDMMKAAAELGISQVEAYRGQPLGRDMPQEVFRPELSPDSRRKIKETLKGFDLSIAGYRGVSLTSGNEELEKEIKFAEEMEIGMLISDSDNADLPFLEEIVKSNNIRVALTEKVDSSGAPEPGETFGRIQKLDRRIGVCADIGSWIRSGINPPETLKSLASRVFHVRLTDLSETGNPAAREVPFGEGKVEIRSILAQLTLQNYGGSVSIGITGPETGEDLVSAARDKKKFIESITYYSGYSQILGSRGGRVHKHGWNHYGPGYFLLDSETGIIKSEGGMGLFWYSVRKYRDFILELEYKCSREDTNSGIFIRVPEVPTSDDYIYHSFEIQIDDISEGIHRTGSAYDAQAPSADAFKPTGEWNHYKITVQGNRIQVELNGTRVLDWEAEPRGKILDFSQEGYIGLQNHDSHSPVYFRNIYIKEL